MTATTEQRCNQVIAERGGQRLGDEWRTVESRIHIRCAHGHEWDTKAANILYAGSWCPVCRDNNRRLGIHEARDYADLYEGRCLSRRYKNTHTPMMWECKEGHRFERSMHSIKEGRWCSECPGRKPNPNTVQGFDRAVMRAEAEGGRHLGEKTTTSKHTRWECQHGHEFTATPKAIITRTYFCPPCAGRAPVTMEQIQSVCEQRGGRCLSPEYQSASAHMEFECANGHRWFAKWRNVHQHGSWCPICARRRCNMGALRSIAEQRGGKILSKKYVDSNQRYLWECENGHNFSARPYDARHKWCSKCPPPEAITMTVPQLIAHDWGGKLLDDKGNRWQCAEGHEFTASLATAMAAWCPTCRSSARQHGHRDSRGRRRHNEHDITAGRKTSPGGAPASA